MDLQTCNGVDHHSHETEQRLSSKPNCGSRVGLNSLDATLDSTRNRCKRGGDGGNGFADGSDGSVVCAECDSNRGDKLVRKLVSSTSAKTCCNPFRTRRLFCVTLTVRSTHEVGHLSSPHNRTSTSSTWRREDHPNSETVVENFMKSTHNSVRNKSCHV